MKNLKILSLTLFGLIMAQVGFGQNITGSAHDFSTAGWNTATTEICIVCHTPHNADGIVSDAPLWNHQVTGQTFTLYSSSTLDATMGQPDASSKLCLSCHDGLTAVDNFGGTTAGTVLIAGAANMGTDLSDDHPVSFTYDAALATTDGDLLDPTTPGSSGLGGTIDDDMLLGGKMQCASCHDVHNGSGESSMLIKSNGTSALCLTCHTK